MMAIVVRGDALSTEDVKKAFDQIEEVDAVISTLGGTPGDPTADSQVCHFVGPPHHACFQFVGGLQLHLCLHVAVGPSKLPMLEERMLVTW
jgi:hypothetical protein